MEAPRDSRPFFLKGFEGRRFPRKPLTHFRVYIPKPPGGKFKLNQDEPNRKRNSQTTWIIRPRAKTANGITDSPSIAPQSPSLTRGFRRARLLRKPLGAYLRIPRNATASRCARRTPQRFRSKWHWRFRRRIRARTAYAARPRAAQARANSAHRSRRNRCQER